jgi:LPS O-antigen subunit length determinant protein (WzzB/FepE family)
VTQTATKQQPETAPQPLVGEFPLQAVPLDDSREWQAEQLRLLWGRRRFFLRAVAAGMLVSTLIAFLIPKSYTSTTQLMPPDQQSTSGLAMMAAMVVYWRSEESDVTGTSHTAV